VPGMRDRWLTMAEGWVELADNVDRSSEAPRQFAPSKLLQIKPYLRMLAPA
jgi:hypothetical protein